MIPVEVTPTPWHYTTFWDWLDHWQTLIAGFLAFVAGVGTVLAAIWAISATRSTAREQIAASRADADSMIAATRAQTEATFKQTETTIRLEELRKANEALSFHGMLAAAMTRVITEATWARKTYPHVLARTENSSVDAYALRQFCITKGAFAELRAACVRLGGPLTAELLDLEREIDSFASQWRDAPWAGITRREGLHAGLTDQLGRIETKAAALSERAIEAFE